jgi:hypothetical protein
MLATQKLVEQILMSLHLKHYFMNIHKINILCIVTVTVHIWFRSWKQFKLDFWFLKYKWDFLPLKKREKIKAKDFFEAIVERKSQTFLRAVQGLMSWCLMLLGGNRGLGGLRLIWKRKLLSQGHPKALANICTRMSLIHYGKLGVHS